MNTNTINTVAAAEITVPKPVAVMTAQAFANVYDENGSYEPNPVAQTLGWSPSANPAIPVKHDNYVFRKDLLADEVYRLCSKLPLRERLLPLVQDIKR